MSSGRENRWFLYNSYSVVPKLHFGEEPKISGKSFMQKLSEKNGLRASDRLFFFIRTTS